MPKFWRESSWLRSSSTHFLWYWYWLWTHLEIMASWQNHRSRNGEAPSDSITGAIRCPTHGPMALLLPWCWSAWPVQSASLPQWLNKHPRNCSKHHSSYRKKHMYPVVAIYWMLMFPTNYIHHPILSNTHTCFKKTPRPSLLHLWCCRRFHRFWYFWHLVRHRHFLGRLRFRRLRFWCLRFQRHVALRAEHSWSHVHDIVKLVLGKTMEQFLNQPGLGVSCGLGYPHATDGENTGSAMGDSPHGRRRWHPCWTGLGTNLIRNNKQTYHIIII